MAKPKRRAFKQYTAGCGLLALFAIVVLLGTAAWVHYGHRKSYLLRIDLEQLHESQAEYTPPPSGTIPAERMRAFLAVRATLFPLCETVSAHQALFSRMQRHGEADEPPTGTVAKDTLRMMTSMFSVGRDFGDYVTTRNEALLAEGLGLGEYTWIYFMAYHAWLDQPPVLALAGKVRKHVYRDRVLAQVREMVRRYVDEVGESPAANAWRAELEALERFPGRIPFEDGLPPLLLASLEPFRDELERLSCPRASELEVVLTEKEGIGFDHR